MTEVFLSLGSNQDPEHHLRTAAATLRQTFASVRFSPVYETAAVGFAGPAFLNGAAVLDTDWDVYRLDRWLHELEDAHGRRRDVPRFSSRTLDIDIVFFGDAILKGPGNLEIPRPELKHAFVLKPLVDLAPDFRVPGQEVSLIQLWQQHPEVDSFQHPGPLLLGS